MKNNSILSQLQAKCNDFISKANKAQQAINLIHELGIPVSIEETNGGGALPGKLKHTSFNSRKFNDLHAEIYILINAQAPNVGITAKKIMKHIRKLGHKKIRRDQLAGLLHRMKLAGEIKRIGVATFCSYERPRTATGENNNGGGTLLRNKVSTKKLREEVVALLNSNPEKCFVASQVEKKIKSDGYRLGKNQSRDALYHLNKNGLIKRGSAGYCSLSQQNQ